MKHLAALLLFVLTASVSIAQSEICGSTYNLELIRRQDPARYERILKFEEHTQNFIRAAKTSGNPAISRLISADKTIIIPVVVHILYNQAVENISDARVESQIEVLNEDFRRLNADAVNTPAAFQPVAADMNIEFRLACVDPNGNPTTGITRTQTTIDLFDFTRPKYTSQGGKDAWPTDTYLNIWVCDHAGGLLGTGTFPSEHYCGATPEEDGVTVDYTVFGVTGSGIYGDGRAAVHEVGHWLNLFHTWGTDEDPNDCASDFVDDTPPARLETTQCFTFPYLTPCSPLSPGEMFMNFMTYSNDGCKNLFTEGQKLRARATFAESTVPGVCTRFSAIENYFSIKPIPVDCGSTIVELQNPMCLPVTWTVTSGTATITPTAETNKYLLTGSGTVTIEAKGADSYIDEEEFTFSVPATITGGTYTNAAPGYGTLSPTINVICGIMSQPMITFFIEGTEEFIVTGVSSNGQIPAWSQGAGNTLYFDGFYEEGQWVTFTISVENSCGSNEYNYTFYQENCEELLLTAPLSIYPNPASHEVTINLKDFNKKRKSKLKDIREITFIDKLGNVKKKIKYPSGTTTTTVNVTDLKNDVYIIEVSDGSNKIRTKLIKTR